jgi:hypothetical protein
MSSTNEGGALAQVSQKGYLFTWSQFTSECQRF